MKRLSFAAALLLGACASAAAGPFYLFPVQEIEGVSPAAQSARPLLDKRVMDRLFGGADGVQAQRAVVGQFVEQLAKAYPASIIHPKQVFDSNIGKGHRFVNDPGLQCKQAPSFKVADTYAVVVGITRASLYEVPKGENIEVLVPVTLSLQFVKPSLGKVVYTMSETVYSPFRFREQEYRSGAADAQIREQLLANMGTQVASLVGAARAAFNPRDVKVQLVGKDGKFYVTDQGFEAGFVKGEQVEARDAAGNASIFDVLYADSGYAVVKPVAGSVSVGDSLQFVFEGAADDSRKPRLMPVVAAGEGSQWASAVSDFFARDLGFKASFQLSPVDVHFSRVQELITREANCVSWDKFQATRDASGRKDHPNFFLRFTPAVSPVSVLSGTGGTKTAEMFHTLVTAQVVDQFGKVIYSELGDDNYVLEKVNGKGLALEQAKEVSLKNAAGKLAQNFINNVRFAPRDLVIARVDKQHIWVEGLAGMSPDDKPTFDVMHPLSAKINGKAVLLDIEAGAGEGTLQTDGNLVGLPYSAVNPAMPRPERGDLLRLYTQSAPGVAKIVDCNEPAYVGQGNLVQASYLPPLVQHAVYRSKRYASHVGDPAFYGAANALLQGGMFDLRLAPPESEMCSQPGYVVREDALQCDTPDSCKATVSLGIVARMKQGGAVVKTISSGLRTEFSGFPSAQKDGLYGYKQLNNGLLMQADLLQKLNN